MVCSWRTIFFAFRSELPRHQVFKRKFRTQVVPARASAVYVQMCVFRRCDGFHSTTDYYVITLCRCFSAPAIAYIIYIAHVVDRVFAEAAGLKCRELHNKKPCPSICVCVFFLSTKFYLWLEIDYLCIYVLHTKVGEAFVLSFGNILIEFA